MPSICPSIPATVPAIEFKVFLTENKLTLKPQDDDFLGKYNLKELYNLLEKDADTLTEDETRFVTLFNKYYLGQVDD